MEGDQVAILHKFMEKQPGKGWADSDKEIKSQVMHQWYEFLAIPSSRGFEFDGRYNELVLTSF